MRCRAWPAALLALSLLLPALASGGEPLGSARAHLSRGLDLYRAGRYADAVEEFEAGHAALPHPTFLLNLAQSWRKLGDLERARGYYARFASETPAGDDAHQQALAAIEKIDGELRARQRVPTAPLEPAAPTAPATMPVVPSSSTVDDAAPAAPSRRAPIIGFTGVGLTVLGAATIGGAAALLVSAERLDDQFVHPAMGTVYDPRVLERRDLDRNLAVGLFVVGGALVTVGTALAARFLPRYLRSRHLAGRAALEATF